MCFYFCHSYNPVESFVRHNSITKPQHHLNNTIVWGKDQKWGHWNEGLG
jgi:hypothetical protein